MNKYTFTLLAMLISASLIWAILLYNGGQTAEATDFVKWAAGSISTIWFLVWMFGERENHSEED